MQQRAPTFPTWQPPSIYGRRCDLWAFRPPPIHLPHMATTFHIWQAVRPLGVPPHPAHDPSALLRGAPHGLCAPTVDCSAPLTLFPTESAINATPPLIPPTIGGVPPGMPAGWPALGPGLSAGLGVSDPYELALNHDISS